MEKTLKERKDDGAYIKHFKNNPASEFVYVRTYSKLLPKLNRREGWPETVWRFISFLIQERGEKIPPGILQDIYDFILDMKVMPSMRALWSAGAAAKADNLTFYNCAFRAVNSINVFGESLYALMCGVGIGFSVEKTFVKNLPTVEIFTGAHEGIYHIEDSKLGWKKSLDVLFRSYFKGRKIEFDYSKLRPRGSLLKTMGGRSSGPEPLKQLHEKIIKMLLRAQGRKLTDIECHDIMCRIGEIVVVGGVRRTACISFSDLESKEMRHAKDYPIPPHRRMSNNSAVYEKKPSMLEFMAEWSALANSGSGERGIANFSNITKFATRRHVNGHTLRANPCLEAILRDMGLCNLTEVVLRAEDTWDEFLEKIKVAVWIGAIQSTFTDFPHFQEGWKNNAEEERLLGVSITGQMDNPKLLTPEKLEMAKGYAIKVAKKAAKTLGINVPAQVTLAKPSGTVSQLVNSASGVHSRYAKYFIRRYRISADDPLVELLIHHGIKLFPEVGQTKEDATTLVVEFPVKAPKHSITRDKMTAIDQLEHYKKVQNNWCEGNASTTIYVKDEEWLKVGAWVYENFDNIIGISFLPYDGGHYELAPYEEIDKEEYERRFKAFPVIDYSLLPKFEFSGGNGSDPQVQELFKDMQSHHKEPLIDTGPRECEGGDCAIN